MAISPTQRLIADSASVLQGAEAKVYKSSLGGVPVLIKHRFNKKYRHPILDGNLTKARVAGEARALIRCLRAGVSVPAIRMVDATEGVLGIEWIEGTSVRRLIPGAEPEDDEGHTSTEEEAMADYGVTIDEAMKLIGTELAKMHLADIIHGDLTTSNMMLRHPGRTGLPPRVYIIDFGLSYTSTLVEDKAVDLYVLERAFASTHPESESMFGSVLKSYEERMGKEWSAVKRRLEDVRMRGRKRSMVG
ncbi:hypothetical protein CYLTODRAFT_377469 [Cylindrobasidium torrendii FP15055 ss-10]|uniref:EKC/KEOPS complex subunit BUD32 n=1 Tax=Cylindrobasidium torrendii FP15055 ss-10 TaxID=1314674 RepID=A0A0D7B814_9AGAR|nr:hypothetical protein CYLTODRAFT_377469 [Cylindrobasidium torrendii FP15055 ss-10]